MAKRSTYENDKELTKKQIAVSRRQQQQRRRVLIGVGVVVALVLGVALAGVYDQLVAKPGRPVATVNGVRIRADQYENRVLYERFSLDGIQRNLQAQLASLDPEDPTSQFLNSYYQQLASQIFQQRLGLDQQVVNTLVEEELARQRAAELGLTVSEDDVNETIRARVATMSGYLTESQATVIASTAQAVTATAETFTPTPIPTATPTLTATIVITITPEVPTPAPLPTRHIITDQEFTEDYANYISILTDETGVDNAEYRSIVRAGLLLDKVREYIADQVPAEAEQTNVSHIQVDTREEAVAVLDRLNAGEDFALVASEVSTDTQTAANGGELGWFVKQELEPVFGPVFETAAFSLSPGEYSDPISGPMGWHIVTVNERAVRLLSERQLQAQQQQAFSDWVTQAMESDGVEILWDPEMAPPDPLLDQVGSGLPQGGVPIPSGQ